jgi:hypothetical protein
MRVGEGGEILFPEGAVAQPPFRIGKSLDQARLHVLFTGQAAEFLGRQSAGRDIDGGAQQDGATLPVFIQEALARQVATEPQ